MEDGEPYCEKGRHKRYGVDRMQHDTMLEDPVPFPTWVDRRA